MIRALPYLIAATCLIISASDLLGQTVDRRWRVTYYDEYYERDVRGSERYTIGQCVQALAEIYKREKMQPIYCTADKLHKYEDEDGKIEQASPQKVAAPTTPR